MLRVIFLDEIKKQIILEKTLLKVYTKNIKFLTVYLSIHRFHLSSPEPYMVRSPLLTGADGKWGSKKRWGSKAMSSFAWPYLQHLPSLGKPD